MHESSSENSAAGGGIIHHNVFYGYNATVFAFTSTVRNLKFFNNTCIGSENHASGFISLADSLSATDSLTIKNNIIWSKMLGGRFVSLGPKALIGSHNAMTNNIIRNLSLNITGTISANDTVDPKL